MARIADAGISIRIDLSNNTMSPSFLLNGLFLFSEVFPNDKLGFVPQQDPAYAHGAAQNRRE
ncbi:hypothetical protein [Methylobacterium sp. P5_C11]